MGSSNAFLHLLVWIIEYSQGWPVQTITACKPVLAIVTWIAGHCAIHDVRSSIMYSFDLVLHQEAAGHDPMQ